MELKERLERVEVRIQAACQSAGRARSDVTLVAVTKTVPAKTLSEAYGLGLRVFGENRLQEALPKIEALPEDVEWHFVGKLQSNKAKRVAECFRVVHTLEKQSQLVQIEKADGPIDALIELNLGREPQKAGILEENLDKTVKLVQQYGNVRLRGLMTVGVMSPDPEGNRLIFRRMAELGREVGAEWLSMGMSADLEAAIQEGSTHVRVGSAIFGERN